ncbi:MAG TPA: hypothetical protein VFC16_12435 [Nakamurella sp.]|nr:hypothetical protein [Nakamurella sp.]
MAVWRENGPERVSPPGGMRVLVRVIALLMVAMVLVLAARGGFMIVRVVAVGRHVRIRIW